MTVYFNHYVTLLFISSSPLISSFSVTYVLSNNSKSFNNRKGRERNKCKTPCENIDTPDVKFWLLTDYLVNLEYFFFCLFVWWKQIERERERNAARLKMTDIHVCLKLRWTLLSPMVLLNSESRDNTDWISSLKTDCEKTHLFNSKSFPKYFAPGFSRQLVGNLALS